MEAVDLAVCDGDAEVEGAAKMGDPYEGCTYSAEVARDGRVGSARQTCLREDRRHPEGRRGCEARDGGRFLRENASSSGCGTGAGHSRDERVGVVRRVIDGGPWGIGDGGLGDGARGAAGVKHPPLQLASFDDGPASHVAAASRRQAQRGKVTARRDSGRGWGPRRVESGGGREAEDGDGWRQRKRFEDEVLAR
jgi:hypothetical protein